MSVNIKTVETRTTKSAVDVASQLVKNDEMLIKREIEIIDESEEITEVHISRLPNEQLAQVEICSNQETGKNDKDPFDKKGFEDRSYEQNKIERDATGLEDDTKLSEIMSDHNYTYQQISQSETCSTKNLREVLLQCFFPEVKSANQLRNISNQVLDFVENTLGSIQSLKEKQIMYEQNFNTINNQDSMKPRSPPFIIKNNEFLFDVAGTCKSINQQILRDHGYKTKHCSKWEDFYQCANFLKNIGKKSHSELYTKEVLNRLMEFAKSLYNDCNSFYLATSTEGESINEFIEQQFSKFKKLVNMERSQEKSVQTDSSFSLKKSKHLNLRAKRKMLLESFYLSESNSDNSSSISAKSSDSFSVGSNMSYCFPIERIHSQFNLKNVDLEYDDGVDLSKYTQSDIFKSEYRNSSPMQTDSEKENRAKPCQTWSEIDGDDITDKEVDRLTNLSCLKKRQVRESNGISEAEKLCRGKSNNQKNSNTLDIWDNDFDNDSSSKSIHQSEDEITENEFKSRCNAHIKRELLNDSSTEIDDCEELVTDLPKQISAYEDDDDDNSLLVDTFLENFTILENEYNDDNQENISSDIEASGICETKKVVFDSPVNSSENKILGVRFASPKQKNKKNLLEMITEADKRNNNGNEEIVLSSESDYSDPADVEPIEEKSRIIKPMLRPDQLANETRKAQKMETERIKKLEKQQAMLAKAIKNNAEKVDTSDVVLDYIEETQTFVKVDTEIVKHLKQHQIDGVKFMYECCYGGVHALRKSSGSGCILAHCMGLGKTLQLIALIHTAVSYFELKTIKVLVLCPKSTVMNWADEIHRWLSPLKKGRRLKVFAFAEPSDIAEKLNVLEEWSKSTSKSAGCLLLGYEAFRTLVFYHSYKNRGNLSTQKLKEIKEKVDTYLLKPGADLVVCDEGHIIKNSKSAISLAVAQITTPKRIILTGTPIQNNLKEYYSMVNFIKPLYLGTEKEFANLYANPIKNGQHKDSSKMDIKIMKQRSFVLHKKLSRFVQRKETELLKSFLPAKLEYVLFVPMTSIQSKLYEHILGAIFSRGDYRGKSLITDYTCLRKIWTHPKVLEDAWKNATNQKNKNDVRKSIPLHSDDDQPDDIYDSQTGVMSVTNDWWRNLLNNKDLETIIPSNKLRAMFEILRMCEEKGEKCLIFSAFVAVLNVVEYFFSKITNADPETLQQISFPLGQSQKVSNMWIRGQDYYRLDGKTPKAIRHEMIKRFNSSTNTRSRVFLISSKAGGQGINLTGANRVIILDTSWNPSNDQQNIFRIFRLGQKKICYIYRLLAMGTMEEKVYSRSVTKQAMSFRVVDEQQIDRHYNMAELAELYTLTKPNDSERPMPILPKDSILASLLMNHPDVVYKYHEHDSLLENKVEQELSEQEKADAWATYERELQMNSETQEVAANIERMQSNFLPTKMPNYMTGSLSTLQMQAFLNYSMYNPQSTPELLPYNYALNSQQYLETLSAYQNLAFNYTDLNTSTQNGVFTPATSMYNSVNAQKFMAPNMSLLSSMHSGVPTSNALSTLGDLSRLGLHHATKIYNEAPAFMAPLASSHVAKYPSSAIQQNSNLNTMNADYSSYVTKSLDKEKQLSINNDQPYQSGVFQQNNASTCKQNMRPSSPILESTGNSKESINQMSAASVGSKKKNPFKTTAAHNPQSKIMSNLFSHTKKPTQQTQLTTDSNIPVNMGIMYPYLKESAKSSKSEDFLKQNSEMQIIPTTSPPGISSISKQLNEIEPNISLTAVRNLNTKPVGNHQNESSEKPNFNVENDKSAKHYSFITSSRPAIEVSSKNTALTPTTPIKAPNKQPKSLSTECASINLSKSAMTTPASKATRRENHDKLSTSFGKSNCHFPAQNQTSANQINSLVAAAPALEPDHVTKTAVGIVEKQNTKKSNQNSSNVKKYRTANSTTNYESVPQINFGAGLLPKGVMARIRPEVYATSDKKVSVSSSFKSDYGQTKLNLSERKRKLDDIINITDAKHQKLTNEAIEGRSLTEFG